MINKDKLSGFAGTIVCGYFSLATLGAGAVLIREEQAKSPPLVPTTQASSSCTQALQIASTPRDAQTSQVIGDKEIGYAFLAASAMIGLFGLRVFRDEKNMHLIREDLKERDKPTIEMPALKIVNSAAQPCEANQPIPINNISAPVTWVTSRGNTLFRRPSPCRPNQNRPTAKVINLADAAARRNAKNQPN